MGPARVLALGAGGPLAARALTCPRVRALHLVLSAAPVLVALACDAGLQPSPGDEGEAAAPIIGGTRSTELDFPATGAFLALEERPGRPLASLVCSGTLIAPDVVLTAAHCTYDVFGGSGIAQNLYFTSTLDVSTFGSQAPDLPPLTTRVRVAVPHPDYNHALEPPIGLGDCRDIGLAFLESEVLGPVPEVVGDAYDSLRVVRNATVAIAGYGQRHATRSQLGVRYHATTVISEVGQKEMQIGSTPPVPQKCFGDSGGPTILEVYDGRSPARRLVGVTSRAFDLSGCNRGGVDTRAELYRAWIDETMRAACEDGTRPASSCLVAPGLPLPAGPPPDAGPRDGGVRPDRGGPDLGPADLGPPDLGEDEPMDAGTREEDAEAPADSGADPEPVPEDSGCGCTAASRGTSRGAGPLVLGALSLALWTALGRRVRRSARR